MTIEEFDRELNAVADVYVETVTEAAREFSLAGERLMNKALEAEIPNHLASAVIVSVARKIEAIQA